MDRCRPVKLIVDCASELYRAAQKKLVAAEVELPHLIEHLLLGPANKRLRAELPEPAYALDVCKLPCVVGAVTLLERRALRFTGKHKDSLETISLPNQLRP